jgi:hypothetical protein
MSDTNAKGILDARLANGDITTDEYDQMLNKITGSVSEDSHSENELRFDGIYVSEVPNIEKKGFLSSIFSQQNNDYIYWVVKFNDDGTYEAQAVIFENNVIPSSVAADLNKEKPTGNYDHNDISWSQNKLVWKSQVHKFVPFIT